MNVNSSTFFNSVFSIFSLRLRDSAVKSFLIRILQNEKGVLKQKSQHSQSYYHAAKNVLIAP